MSLFVQQNCSISNFNTSDSWVILSQIEQSIRRKIETVGKPLKDWDIQIYRGVLTGYNEAFIISTEKRDEILSNCLDEDERKRTAEIIRPILRGRDIQRYNYEWADKWLISTFPARHYDIDYFPAIKDFLLSFDIRRLEQTGKEYIISGEKVKARKKTNNKWFETQDSISYWEDFNKPKIVYREIGTDMDACLLSEEFVVNNKLYILTGNHLEYLIAFFNSRLFNKILMKAANITGGKGADFMYNVPVPMPSQSILQAISATDFACNMEAQKHVDVLFFELLDLSEQERSWISSE